MSIAAARANLVSTLSDTGYTVNGYGRAKFVAPAIFIDESDDFIAVGDVMKRGNMAITFKVVLIQDNKDLTKSVKDMDKMLEAVLMNLGDWSLVPGMDSHRILRFVENGPTYLVTVLSVTNNLTIGDL